MLWLVGESCIIRIGVRTMSKELLFSVTKKDFDVTWFSGTGSGGQYRNKHQNCCRIVHKESGAIGTGQSQRDRLSNQKEAFNNVVASDKFQKWLKVATSKALGEYVDIESKVEKAMGKEHLKVETMENGKWISE
jgi:peptide chain release factor 1